ncbi:MAG: nicotinate phosphoribosyltransferase [Proteobacteria bacterium]|nr:nicotinate phosphoribosyltransferase [Pseudomonadota bacterium]
MSNLYSPLLTDFYQLTMAQGYWYNAIAEKEAVFQLFFRRCPFQSDYVVQCGLNEVIEFLNQWRFQEHELFYLQELVDPHGAKLFNPKFLNYLSQVRFSCDLAAMPEGQLIFPNEPMIRVKGPIIQCQLIETALVNLMSFASLVATKASRICAAAHNDTVLEFGLRRAQGPNGGLTASRSAYIGGCHAVSNTLAAMTFKIPASGTMAHSWIMAFESELQAFKDFAKYMIGNSVLLVDTYDTIQGVHHAISIGKWLRTQKSDLAAIRLDSGDLNLLSKKARAMLDQAGFTGAKIIASGDLDEQIIAQLKQQGAPIDIWGVGTRLVTGWDQPALDCAYKLSAIRDQQGWRYTVKRSDQPGKSTNPGIQQVRRHFSAGRWLGDLIYDLKLGVKENLWPQADHYQDLLQPVFVQGCLVYQQPSIVEIRDFCKSQYQTFMGAAQHPYSVQMESSLLKIKQRLLS